MCDEIGVVEYFDEMLPSERIVSSGIAVKAMILNGLGFTSKPLYMTPLFFQSKPIELLLSSELNPEHINDDSLGRTLDDLYEKGVSEIFFGIAFQAINHFGLTSEWNHLDSTSISVEGDYSSSESEESAVHITYGYSKDHRPDLKQIVANVICMNHLALPVWFEALDGNSSDRKSFLPTVEAFVGQLQGKTEKIRIVADCAWYQKNALNALPIEWISRVPATLTSAKELLSADPIFTQWNENYSYAEVGNIYGGVHQRWLLIHSKSLTILHFQTWERNNFKAYDRYCKRIQVLQGMEFGCEKDAIQAVEKETKTWDNYVVEITVVETTKYIGKGRPNTKSKKISIFTLVLSIATSLPRVRDEFRQMGRFIMATNIVNEAELSNDGWIKAYKEQNNSSERGFRFLKDPYFFADSLFLKKPERIVALLMIMTLCLLVYSLAEKCLRTELSKQGETILNQVGKGTDKPTMRYVFQLFEGISLIIITELRVQKAVLTELNAIQKKILAHMSEKIIKYYGSG